jgi:hypothetical protein
MCPLDRNRLPLDIAEVPQTFEGMHWREPRAHFDLEQKTLQLLDNPFGTRLSPMVSGLDTRTGWLAWSDSNDGIHLD